MHSGLHRTAQRYDLSCKAQVLPYLRLVLHVSSFAAIGFGYRRNVNV